ncbi:MAG: glycosyltransferase family 10 domain-containing protein [Nanoarchaeota archaeon]
MGKICFQNITKGIKEYFGSKFPNTSKHDVLIHSVFGKYDVGSFQGRRLFFSGENLYSKYRLVNVLAKLTKSKMIYLLPNFILKIPLFRIYKKNLNYLMNMSSNDFAIICNDVKGKNIINIPYFMFTHEKKKLNQMIEIKKNNLYSKKKKFCAFIVSNPASLDRIDFFKKLSKYKKVDSYGKVLRNISISKLPKYFIDNDKLYRNYKFVICFENSYAKEYITEKLPNVMMANSIPIYRGAPNVGEYFNTKSFINYDDYGSYDKMIEKIIELDQDDEKYQNFLKEPWFKNNKIPNKIKKKEEDLKKFYDKIFKE